MLTLLSADKSEMLIVLEPEDLERLKADEWLRRWPNYRIPPTVIAYTVNGARVRELLKAKSSWNEVIAAL